MSMVVLRPIEVENPFAEIANWINEDVMPLLILYETSKPKLQRLTDTELRDLAEVLKTEFPQLLTSDGKINWDMVETLYQMGTPEEQKVATFLKNAKALREEFAHATLYEKLNLLDQVGTATSPDNLRKIITVGKGIRTVKEIIEKSNAPDEVKLWFALNSEQFYEKPEVLKLILDILAPKKETEQKKQETTTDWMLNLEPREWKIGLGDTQITFERPSAPKVPTASKTKTEKKKEPKEDEAKLQEENKSPFIENYRPKETGLVSAPDILDLLLGGGFLAGLALLGKKGLPKILNLFRKQKLIQQTQQVAKETSEQATKEAMREARRKELEKRIRDEPKQTMKEARRKELDGP